MESVEAIAEAVLYEGFLLYPYRRSSMKNQQRWTFGGVYPRRFSESSGTQDPWCMQTQCLVLGDEETRLSVKIRFLQVIDRAVAERIAGALIPVETLRVGEQVYRPVEEAIERSVALAGPAGDSSVSLHDLLERRQCCAIDIAEESEYEQLKDPAGTVVGALIRSWQRLQGEAQVSAEPLSVVQPAGDAQRRCYRLTVRIRNAGTWPADRHGGWTRQDALRRAFIATHSILRVEHGEFVSLLEPPIEYQDAAKECRNEHTWPVLVGEDGKRDTLLSSPIILYDYPRISPESPGNLFDATEIDELLTLSILTLTDDEKQEMRESDPRAREILERTEALSPEQVMLLHGTVRKLQVPRMGES